MRTPRTLLWLAVVGAAVAGPWSGSAAAADGSKDELSEGDWEGEHEYRKGQASPPPTCSEPYPGTEPPGGGGGTPTPPDEDGSEPDPDSGESGTPTLPPGETGTPDGGGTPEPEPDAGGGAFPPPVNPTKPEDLIGSGGCPSHWEVAVRAPTPKCETKETLLTVTVLRTDAFAFLCNLYARAESTWYVDWFATTAANASGISRFSVSLQLVSACPLCSPRIDVDGTSALEAKAQTRTLWGSLDGATQATARAEARWSAPVDCSDSCSATAKDAKATSKYSVEFKGVELANTSTASYVFAGALAGKAEQKQVKGAEVYVGIVDTGEVSTYAGGCEDNAQAKARAGYWLRLKGTSNCGAWGEYTVELKD